MAPPTKPGVAQCHFPRMPGDFGAHMLHLCYHLFGNKQSGTAGRESGGIPPVRKADGRATGKRLAQVAREEGGEGWRPLLRWGLCPFLALLGWEVTPSSCESLMPYTTLRGSDLDEWCCPQLLLTGLGGRGGDGQADVEGGQGVLGCHVHFGAVGSVDHHVAEHTERAGVLGLRAHMELRRGRHSRAEGHGG